ncbi:hypothetical protein CDAR_485971 [Caerostris darwini]|uniref:Uncharacterized protein n=1 Tax=Caerostris darwini TaxID=1538125 RepID=A0AAV4WL64_9ARAC|nr:hypothetical protein CDAR_485971 [Caerostris darwini]
MTQQLLATLPPLSPGSKTKFDPERAARKCQLLPQTNDPKGKNQGRCDVTHPPPPAATTCSNTQTILRREDTGNNWFDSPIRNGHSVAIAYRGIEPRSSIGKPSANTERMFMYWSLDDTNFILFCGFFFALADCNRCELFPNFGPAQWRIFYSARNQNNERERDLAVAFSWSALPAVVYVFLLFDFSFFPTLLPYEKCFFRFLLSFDVARKALPRPSADGNHVGRLDSDQTSSGFSVRSRRLCTPPLPPTLSFSPSPICLLCKVSGAASFFLECISFVPCSNSGGGEQKVRCLLHPLRTSGARFPR